MRRVRPDVRTRSLGSMVFLCPVSERGEKWIAEQCDFESWQRTADGILIDQRCAYGIIMGMLGDNLIVQDAQSGILARRPKAA